MMMINEYYIIELKDFYVENYDGKLNDSVTDIKRIEWTKDYNNAFIFIRRSYAERIAKVIGGEVVTIVK